MRSEPGQSCQPVSRSEEIVASRLTCRGAYGKSWGHDLFLRPIYAGGARCQTDANCGSISGGDHLKMSRCTLNGVHCSFPTGSLPIMPSHVAATGSGTCLRGVCNCSEARSISQLPLFRVQDTNWIPGQAYTHA